MMLELDPLERDAGVRIANTSLMEPARCKSPLGADPPIPYHNAFELFINYFLSIIFSII